MRDRNIYEISTKVQNVPAKAITKHTFLWEAVTFVEYHGGSMEMGVKARTLHEVLLLPKRLLCGFDKSVSS